MSRLTWFTYDAKGNLVAGNGLTVTYTASNKAKTITRGTTTIAFDHDPEHQRYAQSGPDGVTLYIASGDILAERFGGVGGAVRWTNYLVVSGQLIGIYVENADETTLTRYFHTDHLGSIAVITNEAGQVTQRLSYDAWGLRRHPDGTPDPAGAIQSESSRGFTGHEHLVHVGLIHMNGRVYDPLLARFGTPDPMTENPYSTQGWNRYSYVGNSPLNFTDPSGYCFMGCFWKPMFAAVGRFFQRHWGTILQIAATTLCSMNPACLPFLPLVAGAVSGFVAGVTSGDLGVALRAAAISAATTFVAQNVLGGVASGNGAGTGSSDWGPPMGSFNSNITLPVPNPGSVASTTPTGALPLRIHPTVPVPSPATTVVGGVSFGQSLLLGGVGAAASYGAWSSPGIRASDYLHRACGGGSRIAVRLPGGGCFGGGMGAGPSLSLTRPPVAGTAKSARPGRLGGAAHRGTVARRGSELEAEGHTITAGGGRLPERSVITPHGTRRFPDISTRDPAGQPYYENVGRSTRSGQPVSREGRALDDIESATGVRPGYTPYDR